MRRSSKSDSSANIPRKHPKPSPNENNVSGSSEEYFDSIQESHNASASMPCSNVQPPSQNSSSAFEQTPSTSQLRAPNHTVNTETGTEQATQTEQQAIEGSIYEPILTIHTEDDNESNTPEDIAWELENTFESTVKFEEFLAEHEDSIWTIKKAQHLKKGEKTTYIAARR